MKWDKHLRETSWFAYSVATCSAVLLYVLLGNLPSILTGIQMILGYISPVILAIVFSYVMDPIAKLLLKVIFERFMRSKRTAWILSCVVTIVFVLAMLIVLMSILVPQVVSSIGNLVGNAGFFAGRARDMITDLSTLASAHGFDISSFTQAGYDLVSNITRMIPSNVGTIISTSFSFGKSVANFVIAFILAIYLLIDEYRLRHSISRLLHALLPEKQYTEGRAFWKRSNEILVRYVSYDLVDAMIVGGINYAFMKITGMQYAALITVIVAVTNLAPTFGPILGAVISGVLLVLIDPMMAIIFLLFTLVLQTIDGYVLKPKLFGGSLGVPSVWILLFLVVGGRMFGVAGILLAIPISAILSFTITDFINRQEKTHPMEDQPPEDAPADSGAAPIAPAPGTEEEKNEA